MSELFPGAETMLQEPATYQIKLACLNCGIKDFYYMPYGSEFMGYQNEENSDTGDRVYSYIHVGGVKEESGVDRAKGCHNCGLPFLVIDYWEAAEGPKKKQKVTQHG